MVIPIQQQAPRRIGFPPDLMSLTTLLFRPMAAIAMIIRNLDNSLIRVDEKLYIISGHFERKIIDKTGQMAYYTIGGTDLCIEGILL